MKIMFPKFILRKAQKNFRRFLPLLALVFLAAARAHASTIYLTADDLGGTNLFGTLDLATGQFHQIATTDPVFLGLTSGPGGKLYGADANSGHLFTISHSGATTQYGSVTAPDAFYGLAYSHSTGNFFADNLNSQNVTLYSIAGNGGSSSLLGQLAGPNSGYFPTGNLVFGPGGKLYFDYSSDLADGGANSTLYTVNTSTGALTPVGSGLGSDILALFSDGTSLYGIDANVTSDIGIFRIDPTTGIATQVSTVDGLPRSNSFFVDAATVKTPDAGSTLLLLGLGVSAVLATGRLTRCHDLAPAV